MRQTAALFLLLSALLLTACSAAPEAETRVPAPGETAAADHTLLPEGTRNTVPHGSPGYCGNTVTTVTYHPPEGEAFTKTFQGGDSVALTDLLRFLDYSADWVCNCVPEYTVDTEFGTGYGLSLSQGYVRYQGGQVQLTAGQVEELRQILARVSEMD